MCTFAIVGGNGVILNRAEPEIKMPNSSEMKSGMLFTIHFLLTNLRNFIRCTLHTSRNDQFMQLTE